MTRFIDVCRGDTPLVVSFPHTGTDIPPELESSFVSPWLARKDADWWIDRLYAFARDLGATTVRTRISRSVIDCNRDPSGASLYPGLATTELCPTTTFDGEPLYGTGTPNPSEIARRRAQYFDPYHAALHEELARLKAKYAQVVLYDAHSIRSRVPRLFEGDLPQFNIGTNSGTSCSSRLSMAVAEVCAASDYGHVVDGRFKGGWTTRHYGRPAGGVHAIQMELAIRGYHPEPAILTADNWPGSFSSTYAAPLERQLRAILQACLDFARD